MVWAVALPNESTSEAAADEESPRGVMGRVRSLKKPIFWLLLWPVIFFVLLVTRALVEMVLERMRG